MLVGEPDLCLPITLSTYGSKVKSFQSYSLVVLSKFLCLYFVFFVGQVKSHHHCDQVFQSSKVSGLNIHTPYTRYYYLPGCLPLLFLKLRVLRCLAMSGRGRRIFGSMSHPGRENKNQNKMSLYF